MCVGGGGGIGGENRVATGVGRNVNPDVGGGGGT